MAKVLVTGANRGLGLEFVRQFLAKGDFVFATCRNPEGANALKNLKDSFPDKLSVFPLDVADEYSVISLSKKVLAQTETLDILINNAGVSNIGVEDEESIESMVRVYRTNVAGLVAMTRTFLPLLKKGEDSRIVNISSKLGSVASMEEMGNGGSYAYNASKAAVNMVSKKLALNLKSEGIVVIAQAPGWAKTDMGGEDAEISPEQSVSGMLKIMTNASLENSGHFYEWDGQELPW